MKVKITTLPQLIRYQWKKVKDMPDGLARNYYNIVKKAHIPRQITIEKLCEFFDITEEELLKLI